MKANTGKIEDDNIVQEQEKLTKIAIYHSRLQTWVPQSKYREPLRNRKKKNDFRTMFVIPMECIFFGYTFLVILNYFKNHWLYLCSLYLKLKYNQKAGITKKSRYNKKNGGITKKKTIALY